MPAAISVRLRPLMPIDETRYASVAWEMWQRGDFLLPRLNSAPYSHKPPVLFWLFHAGWWLFGPNEWWPELVPVLAGLGCLLALRRLARFLWPELPEAQLLAPLILLGLAFWDAMATVVMPEILLLLCVLLALAGLAEAWRNGTAKAWLVLGGALGLGALSKGPVVLVHTLPVALAAPWWASSAPPRSWRRWYAALAGATALGAAIGLAWAIPAARAGGHEYGTAILWRQTAGRILHSFAHRRPWWWYLPFLPAMALPYAAWPDAWRHWAAAARSRDAGSRFCGVWILFTVAIFSAISGKQIYYILPVLPALALLLACGVARAGEKRAPRALQLPGVFFLALGTALCAAPFAVDPLVSFLRLRPPPDWVRDIEPAWAAIPIGAGLLLALLAARNGLAAAWRLTGATVVTLLCVEGAVFPVAGPAYDLHPIARRLAALEAAGLPIAHVGDYQGQFHFLGRLRRPFQVIRAEQASAWAQEHPEGRIVTYYRAETNPPFGPPEFTQPFRGQNAGIWNSSALRHQPSSQRAP